MREVTPGDVVKADGLLFCAPENLATVSGEMKEFFDRIYYDMFEWDRDKPPEGRDEVSVLLGRPCGVAIAAGSDGQGARAQIERICTGLRLEPVAESLVERNGLVQTAENILRQGKVPSRDALERCNDLGGRVAATVLLQERWESLHACEAPQ